VINVYESNMFDPFDVDMAERKIEGKFCKDNFDLFFCTVDEVCNSGGVFETIASVPSDVRCFLCGGSFCPPKFIIII